ncbi:hypothetical protein ACO0LM_23795 [Undibacterium sp. Di26W]|uniref:hypothetical protein n=1 Tax=Undibacterium sp. Di26W TaxID=3413035 RepID=UPI003BF2BF41
MTNLTISISTGNRRRFARTMSSMALSASGIALVTENEALAANVVATAAVNAYLAANPAFKEGELVKIAGRLATDDTIHWTIVSATQGTEYGAQMMAFT